ncbi:MAG: DUF6456 domain-containing protein [Caulobacteraceae bacterium]
MSEARIARALVLLAKPGAVLAERSDGAFGVFRGGDRRRRPPVLLLRSEVIALASDGAIAPRSEGVFVLSTAGGARVRRETAETGEAFAAQHRHVVDRPVIDAEDGLHIVRGFDPDALMRRLASLRGPARRPWLEAAELAAANQLRRDWATAEIGMLRGSDWTAAPIGSTPRGGANAQEAAMARRCDARRRVGEALDKLAPSLRRVVERVCLEEVGLEMLERMERWPPRSAKLALKLGLAQLAAAL